MRTIENVAVIGAGLMGTNIALDFARAGLSVRITESNLLQVERSRATLRSNAAQLAAAGLMEASPVAVAERVEYRSSVEEAIPIADLVIEAVSEDLALKQRLFRELDQLSPPHAILASNTSSLMPSLLAEVTRRPEQVIVTHYWNPAHLIPLVELVPSPTTSAETVETLQALYLEIGKKPAVVRKECLGFIGNRLQFAMLREAMSLIESGVATPEDIDTVVRYSFGRRLPVTGLFRTADLAGLDTLHSICGILFPDLSDAKVPGPSITEHVARGRFGTKAEAGWYDYTPEEVAELRTRLFEALIRQARED